MLRKGPSSVFFLLLLVTVIPNFCQEPEYPATSPIADIVFLTGRENGTYFALGSTIKELVERKTENVKIICQPSIGSLENATLLEANKANMAIIQSDIAYSLYSGTRFFTLPSSRIKVICPLHSEIVHIVTRRSSHINSLDDLEGQTISVGERGSGAEVNAGMILASINLTYRNINPIFKNQEVSTDLLRAGDIDAFFATTRSPSTALATVLEDTEYALLKLKPVEIERIVQGYPYIYQHIIERGTYPNQVDPVPTIKVRALLVAHSEVKDSKIYQITRILFQNKDYLKKKHPFLELDERDTVSDLRLPLHPGTRKYIIEAGVLRGQSIFVLIGSVLFVIVGASLLVYFFIHPPKHFRRFAKNFYARYITFFLFFVAIASYGMHLSERAINLNFVTYARSIWSCLVYLFSGFGDRAPITVLGKLLSILIFIMGLSVVGVISGRFASYFIEKTIRKEKKMPGNLNDHIVICNWNAKAEKIVEELFRSEVDTKRSIQVVVLAENRTPTIDRFEWKYSGFSMSTGDPVLHDRLEAVHIHRAKSIIILAKEDSPDPDAQTALIALAISQVCKEKNPNNLCPLPHIVADVVNHRKTRHLSDTHVEEIVCPSDYGIGLLAQSAVNPGLVKVYDHLLRFKPDGNEIYLLDSRELPTKYRPNAALGNFPDLAKWFREKSQETANPTILLGFLREGKPILNPKKLKKENEMTEGVLRENDKLILLAYEMPRIIDLCKTEPGARDDSLPVP